MNPEKLGEVNPRSKKKVFVLYLQFKYVVNYGSLNLV
jgi:hypothetical protein